VKIDKYYGVYLYTHFNLIHSHSFTFMTWHIKDHYLQKQLEEMLRDLNDGEQECIGLYDKHWVEWVDNNLEILKQNRDTFVHIIKIFLSCIDHHGLRTTKAYHACTLMQLMPTVLLHLQSRQTNALRRTTLMKCIWLTNSVGVKTTANKGYDAILIKAFRAITTQMLLKDPGSAATIATIMRRFSLNTWPDCHHKVTNIPALTPTQERIVGSMMCSEEDNYTHASMVERETLRDIYLEFTTMFMDACHRYGVFSPC